MIRRFFVGGEGSRDIDFFPAAIYDEARIVTEAACVNGEEATVTDW